MENIIELDKINRPPLQLSFETLDLMSVYVFIKDLNNKFIWVNKYLANAWGLKREELIGIDIKDSLPGYSDFDYDAYAKDDIQVITSGIPISNIIEYFPTKYYGLKCVSTTKAPYIIDGKVIGVLGMSIDITDYKSQSLEFELLLDSLSDAFIIMNYEGKILKIHWGKIEILKQCTDCIGKNISEIESKFPGFYSEFQVGTKRLFDGLKDNKDESYYFEYYFKDKLYECNLDFFNHSKIVISVRDITFRKKMDQLDILLNEVNETNSSLLKNLLEWK